MKSFLLFSALALLTACGQSVTREPSASAASFVPVSGKSYVAFTTDGSGAVGYHSLCNLPTSGRAQIRPCATGAAFGRLPGGGGYSGATVLFENLPSGRSLVILEAGDHGSFTDKPPQAGAYAYSSVMKGNTVQVFAGEIPVFDIPANAVVALGHLTGSGRFDWTGESTDREKLQSTLPRVPPAKLAVRAPVSVLAECDGSQRKTCWARR